MPTSKLFHTLFLIGVFTCLISALLALPAYAQSLAEIEHAADDIQAEYDECIQGIKDIEGQVEDLDRQMESVRGGSSKERARTEESIVALYKMGNSRDSLIEMLLDADSLTDAINLWESYNTMIDSCSNTLQRTHDKINEIEQSKHSLERQKADLEISIEGKKAALEDTLEQANAKKAEVEELLSCADNSGLARLSCSLAYSKKVRYSEGYPATAAYEKAWKAILPGDSIPQGRSCDRGVMIPIRLAGFDDEFPTVCTSQFEYMQSSERWVDLGVWNGSTSSLEPGDILVSIAGIDGASYDHSCMYVGYDIAQEIYDNIIKGTDGDLGRPDESCVFSSASYQWGSDRGRAICICVDGEVGSHVFRCVNPQHSTTYSGVMN